MQLTPIAAETYPDKSAITLRWDIPLQVSATNITFASLDTEPLVILRRERRFPGKNRRGIVRISDPSVGNDQEDGIRVYDSLTFEFDFEEQWEDRDGDRIIVTHYQYQYHEESRDRILVRSIRKESTLSPRGGEPIPQRMTVRLIDRQGLTPDTIYYYTAFSGPDYGFSSETQASALATDRYGHSLFTNLPQVHQQFDTVLPPAARVVQADQQKGQLQRLLEVFDAHADMLHSMIGSLSHLHNPRRVDSRFLPSLAHFIGWRFKTLQNEDRQRNEIRFAHELYQNTGTIPNITAIINLLTGWKTEVKEFVHNVLVSVDTTRFEQLNDGVVYADSIPPMTGDIAYLDGSLQPTDAYAEYLKGVVNTPLPSPHWQGRRFPNGSIDTRDEVTMAKLRAKSFDDQTVYTYHAPPADQHRDELPDPGILYNQGTIGLYITADVNTESFTPELASRHIYRIVREFLPLQVRPIIYVRLFDVEEIYTDDSQPKDELVDEILGVSEVYGTMQDAATDQIPGWQWLISNDPDHHSVDTDIDPTDTISRTRHIGLDQAIDDDIE